MTDPTTPTNFIRTIIDKDLAANKVQKIQTRFPPEPNGFLHIGHAKSICLNFGIAKDYNGVCNLRLDDTNPDKENLTYVDAIKKDIEWLGFKWDSSVKHSSDYFDELYDYAVKLIQKGLAYVCFLDNDEARIYRGSLTNPGKNSPYRDTEIDENLTLFAKMKAGDYQAGECVLRAKIDMNSSFICLRDPIIYRIRFVTHHRLGDQWCIYPMYDFAHCISDAIENISHSLCTLEFQDNRRLYDWFLDNLWTDKTTRPYQYEFARLNLEYTIMSKRKLNELVQLNLVDGWDDPRMLTISGLRRRGFPAAAIVEFCRIIGVSKQDSFIALSVLENIGRDNLNDNATRTMAVLDPIKVIIENYSDNLETLSAPNHPKNVAIGNRTIHFSNTLYIDRADFKETANKKYKRLVLGKEVRLRNAYVIKAERIKKNTDGTTNTIYCHYDADTLGKNPSDGRKIKGVIHFVEASTAIPANFHLYDRLFNVPNPAKETMLKSVVNHNSLIIKQGFVEPTLKNPRDNKTYQFEREGYFCHDKSSTHDHLVFNRTLSLRNTWDD